MPRVPRPVHRRTQIMQLAEYDTQASRSQHQPAHTTANHTHVEAKGANGGMTIPAPSITALATINFIEKRMWIRLFRQLFDYHPNGSGRSKNASKEGSEGKLMTGAEVPFTPQPNGHTNGSRHGECHAGKPQERAGF